MQPNRIDPSTVKADLAAAEREAQYVNPEQIMAAALFAKQLQADLTGIKKAAVGEGLKVSNVDMSKVMPSHILKTHRPVGMPGMPNMPVRPPPPPEQVTPVQEINIPPVLATVTTTPAVAQSFVDQNQLELDFDKKARYIEVVEAIERLERKINAISVKLDDLQQNIDKKKLTLTQENGT